MQIYKVKMPKRLSEDADLSSDPGSVTGTPHLRPLFCDFDAVAVMKPGNQLILSAHFRPYLTLFPRIPLQTSILPGFCMVEPNSKLFTHLADLASSLCRFASSPLISAFECFVVSPC